MHTEQEVHYAEKLSDGTKTDTDRVRQKKRKRASQSTDVKADCLHNWEEVDFSCFPETEKPSRSTKLWHEISARVVSVCCLFIIRLHLGLRVVVEEKKRSQAISWETHQSSRCLLGISILVTVQVVLSRSKNNITHGSSFCREYTIQRCCCCCVPEHVSFYWKIKHLL